ncbi:hypothetical protein MIND_01390600 [Mycena indigotica]|uniref:RTA1-domain-containing protein n=1 Tax=Mycena indigotica TaxID=2126181 RepID=A0A8H6RZ69_9AGAR|nr:uncharacterized protein MIND_01390600 [Mycena indigotica]KAF7289290.1 hypothetical protein MIND_01390600 [Mycena indigotica]
MAPSIFSRFFPLLLLTLTSVAAVGVELEKRDDAAAKKLVPGGYIPKKFPAVLGLILYGFSGILHWIHFARSPVRWILALPIGMITMAIGFGLRLYFVSHMTKGIYIAMYLFILLSPCLYLAADYAILSHLTATFDKSITDRALLIRPTRIVRIFVWSDVLTFLIQAGGGTMLTNDNPNTRKLGSKVAMIGLILQGLSFMLFTVLVLLFAYRVRRRFPEAWGPKRIRWEELSPVFGSTPIDEWRPLLFVVVITCIGILIRSVFRLIEFAEGSNGYLQSREGFFYALDALPLWISMSLYCIVWPARFTQNTRESSAAAFQMGPGSKVGLATGVA